MVSLFHRATINKPKSKRTLNFKNCSCVCAYHMCTTQHRTVLIIFPVVLQTVEMFYIGLVS